MAPLLFHLGIEGGRYGALRLIARPPLINASMNTLRSLCHAESSHLTPHPFLHIFISSILLCALPHLFAWGSVLKKSHKHTGLIKMLIKSNNGSWCILPVFSASFFCQISRINRKQELKTRSTCLFGDWSSLASRNSEQSIRQQPVSVPEAQIDLN